MTDPRLRGSISPARIALSSTLFAIAAGCDGGMVSGVVGMGGAPLVTAQAGAPGTSATTGGGTATTNGSAAGAASSAAGATSVTGGGSAGASTSSTPGVAGSGTVGSGGLGAGGTLGASGMAAVAGMGDTGAAGPDVGGAGSEGGSGGAPVGEGGGPAVSNGDPVPSTGCGQAPPASDRYDIDVDGLTREYILEVPESYEPDKPYRLIFGWHPWGGSADWVAQQGYYGLLEESGGDAIFVSAEGLDFGGNGLGWGNENGQDIALLEAMLDRFDAELCFDHSRVFSVGFSFGGMMSNAVACSGLARAVAPMAGNSNVAGCEDGTQPVAYMGFHGVNDSVVDIEGGRTARDVFVERNGCGEEMESTSDYCDGVSSNYQPCACVTYAGCQEGYPVTWCEYTSDHMVAPSSAKTVWSFFSQF